MIDRFIRGYIRDILKEEVFSEAARRIESLPDTAALFVKELNSGYTLVIYDPTTKNAYATITIISNQTSPRDSFYSTGVAAEKGFGPFIYELGMMVAGDRGLMPSRDGDVRGEAWNVWKNFYKRDDVKKETIPLEDDDFSFKIIEDHGVLTPEEKQMWFWQIQDDDYSDETNLELFNSIFKMKPDSQFEELYKRGEEYIDKGFDLDDAIDEGDKLWREKYN